MLPYLKNLIPRHYHSRMESNSVCELKWAPVLSTAIDGCTTSWEKSLTFTETKSQAAISLVNDQMPVQLPNVANNSIFKEKAPAAHTHKRLIPRSPSKATPHSPLTSWAARSTTKIVFFPWGFICYKEAITREKLTASSQNILIKNFN